MPTRLNTYPRGAVRDCVSGQADYKKTASEYASSEYIVWGAKIIPTYLRSPNICYLRCCPVPCQVDGTPVLCIAASAASPYVRVCFVFSDVCFLFHDYCYHFCPSISAFPLVSCVVLAPPAGHKTACLVFRPLCRCSLLLFYFFLVFHLVLSCRPSVGPSPRHIVGLVVPADSNLVPSGLGLRPVRMHEVYCFVFLSFCYGNVRT